VRLGVYAEMPIASAKRIVRPSRAQDARHLKLFWCTCPRISRLWKTMSFGLVRYCAALRRSKETDAAAEEQSQSSAEQEVWRIRSCTYYTTPLSDLDVVATSLCTDIRKPRPRMLELVRSTNLASRLDICHPCSQMSHVAARWPQKECRD
jgi:hypothetical protein